MRLDLNFFLVLDKYGYHRAELMGEVKEGESCRLTTAGEE